MQPFKKTPTKNKSISPRKTTPLKSSPSSNKLTKTPTPVKYQYDPLSNSQRVKNREKLSQTLDQYTLLIRSKNPIRCLQHNSNISIYCETQQKLLCANCIFGRTDHKFHRVTPIDRSMDKIEKDIDTMNRLIDREIQSMRKTCEILVENLLQEENDAHDSLSALVQQYEDCHHRLQDHFLYSKSKIIEKLQSVRTEYERSILELKLNLENYSASTIIKPLNKQYFKREEQLLFEHVVCSAIVSQKKFEQKSWVTNKREIHSIASQQRKKVMTLIEVLNKLTANNKK